MGDERKVPRGEPFRKTVYAYEGGVKEGEGEGEGRMVKKRHDYVFHVFEPTMGCTIRNLPFGHPRQLTTRRRLNTAVGVNSETYYNSIDPRRRCALEGKRSANTTLGGDDDDDDDDGDDVDGEVAMIKRVDISLRTLISGPPSIMLLFQVDTEAETVAEEERIRQMITIDVSIGLNGQIDVTDVSGPWQEEKKDVEVVYEDDDGEEEGKECKEEDAITKELRGKLKKVLEICEDLSVAIEWMEEWVKRWRRGRRRDGRWG
ncbi:hypothetical protein KEM54_003934 [Ascosphaera aggregata]|nr:hypothetical protein KEM54_003934 [Ascosphaera aggregata]